MNNAAYWEERQLKRYTSGERKLIEHYKKLEKVMEQSRKDIEAVINKFYIEYASENEISYAEAQRVLSKREIGELKDFIDRVNEHMGEYDQELNNMSIKARITRYEALLKQIDAVLQRTYTEYEQTSLRELAGIYEDTYYRACFDIDQYNGFHKEFAQLDQKGIEELINYPFDGKSFSERIWKQKDFLLDKLTQSFTQMLVQGTHPKTLSKEFAKQFKSREYDAYRLLHTEYSYLAENASQKAYEEDEVPAYKYLATLDSRTCGVCGKLDGKIVKMGDGKFGVNMPPLHPLCRCTTVPYYEELDEDVTRIARNKDGENIEVPHDMSYEEWKKLIVFEKKIENSNKLKLSYKNGNILDIKFKIRKSDLNVSEDKKTVIEAFVKLTPKVQRTMSDVIVDLGNRGSACDCENGIIYAALNLEKEDVYHEFGHLVESRMMSPEDVVMYKQFLVEGLSIQDITTEIYYNDSGDEFEIFILHGARFVSEYQGRLYVDKLEDAINIDGSIKIETMLETISEPFRMYQLDKKLLYGHEEILKFIERTVK